MLRLKDTCSKNLTKCHIAAKTKQHEKLRSTKNLNNYIYIYIFIFIFMAWLRERRLRTGSSTSPAGTLVTDKADAGEACPVAVVAGEGLVWD